MTGQMQFNMNLIGTCINAATAWYSVTLQDRMPRRKVLVIGTFGCSLMLAANAGLSAKWDSYTDETGYNLAIGRTAAAFFFLFGVVYAFTVRIGFDRFILAICLVNHACFYFCYFRTHRYSRFTRQSVSRQH